MSFGEIILSYATPDEAGVTEEMIDRVARQHFSSVMRSLPTAETLPDPQEAMPRSDLPARINAPVTIGSIIAHLAEATPETPEIAVNVFPDGTNTLEIGDVNDASPSSAWSYFSDHSEVDFHTHPDPEKAHIMHEPSMKDIQTATVKNNQITLIGSSTGLTYVPPLESGVSAQAAWAQYLIETRGFDETGYEAYGPRKVYSEFIADVVQTEHVPWSDLDPDMTLSQAAARFILSQPPRTSDGQG